jgi:purine nucleoside phosphorylase
LNRENDAVLALARSLEEHGAGGVELALVLGSGLGSFAERLENSVVIAFEELEGIPRSAVAGHAGRIVVGEIGGSRVISRGARTSTKVGAPLKRRGRCARSRGSGAERSS